MAQDFTSERVVEEPYRSSTGSYLIYLFHVASYRFAEPWVIGRDVLDFGCGSGYGAALLAPWCRRIVGVDVSEDTVRHASRQYARVNSAYLPISKTELGGVPFADASFDVVVSVQVMEHIRAVRAYLAEIRRVLRPGGVAIFSTPDRSSRLLPFQKPWNPWHVREYSRTGLRRLLSRSFVGVGVLAMTGVTEVLAPELRRTRRLRWMSLPFTLPLVPEWLRTPVLRLLSRLRQRRQRGSGRESPEISFDETALRIATNAQPSVNLLAVAHRPDGPG